MQRIRKLILITVFATCLTAVQTAVAGEQNDLLESQSTLPSVQTQNQLDQLSSDKIGTRQAPDEEGWAQKETPIETADVAIWGVLAILSTTYCLTKKRSNV